MLTSTAPRKPPLSQVVVALLMLTVLLVLIACSSAGGGTDDATHEVAAPPATADPVGALVLGDVARGFTAQPERASHTGATDLAEAVRADGHRDARAALTTEGFQHGYQRLWADSASDTIGVQVYRFGTAAGARQDYKRNNRLAADQAQHVTRYRVGVHPTSEVRGAEVDVEGNVTEQVIGVAGRDVMQVVCTSRTAAGLRSRAMGLGSRQYDRIAQTG